MQALTGVRYTSSEQHKDITIGRVHRDMNDILKLLNFPECRNPFMEDSGLRNIANGVMANAAVNTDKALSVGNSILKQMTGQKIGEYKFQKKNQVTLINIKHVETVKNNQMIDQQLLFQRLLIVAKGSTHDISSIFNYELSVYPTAMFETSGIFRKANKPALADAILKSITMSDTLPTENSVQYVIVGGSLLHQIPWKRGMKYSEIFKLYTEYIRKKYNSAIVVFDGYKSGPSTKDMAHLRRTSGCSGTEIKFNENMILTVKKQLFLLNKGNKQLFINELGRKLQMMDCKVYHAGGDADCLIVKQAIESALTKETILVGEDTD